MPRWQRSLRARFGVALGLILLPLGATGVLASVELSRVSDRLTAIATESLSDFARVHHLQEAVFKFDIIQKEYVAHGEPSAIKALAGAKRQLAEDVGGDPVNAFSAKHERRVARAAVAEVERVQTLAERVVAIPDPELSHRRVDALDRQVDLHATRAIEYLERLDKVVLAGVASERAGANRAARAARIELSVGAGAGLLFALLIGVHLSRAVINPIRRLQTGLGQMAAGEYGHRLATARLDEIGDVERGFNRMATAAEAARAALVDSSSRDALTGAMNRREFESRFAVEMARAERHNAEFTLVMLDLDHFKQVNDGYGHQAGDDVLRECVARLDDELRATDVLARLGGEEFAALLPETGGADGVLAAERMRVSIASRPMPTSAAGDIAITISAGVAVYPADGDERGALVEAADAALYAAKQAGRNRVERARVKASVVPADSVATAEPLEEGSTIRVIVVDDSPWSVKP